MDWKKFWDWQWPYVILVLGIVYLSISLSSCTTVEKTAEEKREAWYQSCVQTSNAPDASAESCRWRADRLKYGD